MIKLFYMVLQKEEKILQEKRGPPKEVSLLDLDDCKYFTHPDLSYSIFEKERKNPLPVSAIFEFLTQKVRNHISIVYLIKFISFSYLLVLSNYLFSAVNPVSDPLSSVTLLCPTSAADLEGLSLSGSSVIDVSHFFMDKFIPLAGNTYF